MSKIIMSDKHTNPVILSWDLPAYDSEAFNDIFPNRQEFRQLPIYEAAVKGGLIVDDEWVGPEGGYCEIPRKRE